MMKIVTNPNPKLRRKSVPVKDISTEEMQALIPDMIETMIKKDGLGLAAPQVGYNLRLITVRHKSGDLAMVNPVLIKKSLLKEIDEEGCLSVPSVFGQVKRCKKITVKYQDPGGKLRKLSGEGLFARIVQHEIDHLDGILFIDKAKNLRTIDD